MDSFWRRCSTCKRELGFAAAYWTCNVSTCNRKGSSFVFCSLSCWNSHVPTMRYREAWAEEQRSPEPRGMDLTASRRSRRRRPRGRRADAMKRRTAPGHGRNP